MYFFLGHKDRDFERRTQDLEGRFFGEFESWVCVFVDCRKQKNLDKVEFGQF